MKLILTAVNARYYHVNLAVRLLRNALVAKGFNSSIYETSINDRLEHSLAHLYKENANIYGFSVYIWNVEFISKLCRELKKLLPNSIIILGGPEVSHNPAEVFNKLPCADYIVCGEGEIVFPALISALEKGKKCSLSGIVTKDSKVTIAELTEFCDIPQAYLEGEVENLKDKILYYESSRGCPFSCAYCLSGSSGKVRQMPVDRVKKDIEKLCIEGAGLIKFVDRTFNADRLRAREIFTFLSSLNFKTQFHFKICASLLQEEDFEILKSVPKDKFRFEIGIQSTNKKTLNEITRIESSGRALEAAKRLKEYGNIHLHVDLIAGLPFEDYLSFSKSFNQVYPYADVLQLGFLKLLYGSVLREKAKEYEYLFTEYPPYEFLQNRVLSYNEVLRLKGVESALNKYKNSGAFEYALDYLIPLFPSPFSFYETLSDFLKSFETEKVNISRKDEYRLLYEFALYYIEEKIDKFSELLKLDFIKYNRGAPPFSCSKNPGGFKEKCSAFFADSEKIKKYIQQYEGVSPKNIIKYCDIHLFNFEHRKVLLFDRRCGKIVDITDCFE